MSYDVAALFTSIPVKPAIEVVKKKLEQDTELHQEPPCPPKTSWTCWSLAYATPVSCSRAIIMSKPRGQLWVLL